MKKLVILTLLLLGAFVVACAKEDLPPTPPAPGEVGGAKGLVGKAFTQELAAAYADPTGFFDISFDTPAFGDTLTADCHDDQFIYATGYDTDVNGQWRKFGYDCNQKVGSWCRGSVSSAIANREVTENNYAAGDNYIVCYGCTKEKGVWNCHGNKWMAHQFNVHEPAATQVCGNGAVEEGEQCDDNNLVNGDGCSSGCIVEPPVSPACVSDAGCSEGQFCNDAGQCEALPTAPEGLKGKEQTEEVRLIPLNGEACGFKYCKTGCKNFETSDCCVADPDTEAGCEGAIYYTLTKTDCGLIRTEMYCPEGKTCSEQLGRKGKTSDYFCLNCGQYICQKDGIRYAEYEPCSKNGLEDTGEVVTGPSCP